MTIVWIVLSIIAYLLVGAIISHLCDLYFGTGFDDEGSTIGVAVMWPLIIVGAILYGAWQLICHLAVGIVDFFVELVKYIFTRNKNQI